MGTDIYLYWDGSTEADHKKQITGFSIDAGNVGYLRASIGMREENAVLRKVFPNEFWWLTPKGKMMPEEEMKKLPKETQDRGPIYDFTNEKNVSNLHGAIRTYLSESMAESVDLSGTIMWTHSLYRFYSLGCQKQREGKNPRVYISW